MIGQRVTRLKHDLDAALFRDVERLRDAQIERIETHDATDDGDIGAVSPIRIGERPIKRDVREPWRSPEQLPSHEADARGSGRMRTRWTDHDRSDDIKHTAIFHRISPFQKNPTFIIQKVGLSYSLFHTKNVGVERLFPVVNFDFNFVVLRLNVSRECLDVFCGRTFTRQDRDDLVVGIHKSVD